MRTKKQIMDANRMAREHVAMRKQVQEAIKTREYDEWKRRTDEAIARINAKIRATNGEG
jgi:hypothetical protein